MSLVKNLLRCVAEGYSHLWAQDSKLCKYVRKRLVDFFCRSFKVWGNVRNRFTNSLYFLECVRQHIHNVTYVSESFEPYKYVEKFKLLSREQTSSHFVTLLYSTHSRPEDALPSFLEPQAQLVEFFSLNLYLPYRVGDFLFQILSSISH